MVLLSMGSPEVDGIGTAGILPEPPGLPKSSSSSESESSSSDESGSMRFGTGSGSGGPRSLTPPTAAG
eukprot:CAMPEP_0113948244 /NCGR_PEP_ID=MMETSP1339-20121228/69357_1 /TAXON_ID=94617 /ORGANISM="Fibrocapsa japonica" /LENGTH=67 /DNA_ID=CAMNT_0000955225 /DNA_START=94 /DNA_END=297 /DNA_ORIENTATION=- /assembly_acc=CAM_ASM_000762